MNQLRFSPEAEQALSIATQESTGLEQSFLGVEHVFLGLFGVIHGKLADAFAQGGVELEQFTSDLRSAIARPTEDAEAEDKSPTRSWLSRVRSPPTSRPKP